ncbi:unnamed protein product [Adineta ricciae]|uniref:Exonuclease domain-containing protein n=1 Tax=Adineta ricciae TaxID=249248 RepID=A0A814G891_ADIRI|nr:unnamed protein product [Adineta ricciae]CAF0993157.1 unnamed protein product [Adineta ricciae]
MASATEKSSNDQISYSTAVINERSQQRKTVAKTLSQKQLNKLSRTVSEMQPGKLQAELRRRNLSTSGILDIQRMRLKTYLKIELMEQCTDPLAMIEQPFDYIAVVDFEATCEKDVPNYLHEIIEFPIVLVDVKQQTIIDQFRSYCRPERNPVLSQFCRDLTGIQQHQVDTAPTFAEVLHNVERWLNERNLSTSASRNKFAFATDGPWDFANFLQMQCRLNSLPYPEWANQWINIRKVFARFYSMRSCGIVKMLQKLGFSFEGQQHSGLDDSTNIARIAVQLLKDGCILSLNDGIRDEHSNDNKATDDNEIEIVFED